MNLYSYCSNNPITYVDPDGHSRVPLLLLFAYLAETVLETVPDIAIDAALDGNNFNLAKSTAINYGTNLIPVGGEAYTTGKIGKKAALKIVSEASSQKLRSNMIKAGIKAPNYSNAAHHIVAGGKNIESAIKSRAILEKFGIGINDAVNGVFLPDVVDIAESTYHRTLHTDKYYNKVYNLLNGVETKAEAMEVLKYIAEQLQSGTF